MKKENGFGKLLTREEGFTLMELMVSLSIFAIGLLGVASMQTSGILGTATAKWHTESSSFASTEIERILTLPYSDADLTAGDHGPVVKDKYSIQWNVADDRPIANTKTLKIQVTWKDHNANRETSYTYYKGDH